MRVMVVVDVEVQVVVVVTYLVAACAEAARRRVRRIGWCILTVDDSVRAKALVVRSG